MCVCTRQFPRFPPFPSRLHGNENCPFVQQSVVIYVLPAVSSCNRMCTTLYIQIPSIYVSNTIHPPLLPSYSFLASLLPSFLFGMRLRPWGQVQNATNAAVFTLESYFEWKRCAAMHKLMAKDNRVLTKHSCTHRQKRTEREKFQLEFRCEQFERCYYI